MEEILRPQTGGQRKKRSGLALIPLLEATGMVVQGFTTRLGGVSRECIPQ